MLLYSERMAFHLDKYTCCPLGNLLLVGCVILSHSSMQTASTRRLFEGKEAGDPAARKHLKFDK